MLSTPFILHLIPSIHTFTIEEESKQQFAFLDTLVSRKDNMITIDVFRKATHTDRYLDYFSHHDKSHKISTAETLLHCAIKLPSTAQGKNTEINHVTDALRANNYPSDISNILKKKFSKPPTHAIPSSEELVCIFLNGLRLQSILTVKLSFLSSMVSRNH